MWRWGIWKRRAFRKERMTSLSLAALTKSPTRCCSNDSGQHGERRLRGLPAVRAALRRTVHPGHFGPYSGRGCANHGDGPDLEGFSALRLVSVDQADQRPG